MPDEKTGIFEEAPGEKSMMRVSMFIALLASIAFGYLELKAASGFPYITTMFLGSAFGGKVFQKFAETK